MGVKSYILYGNPRKGHARGTKKKSVGISRICDVNTYSTDSHWFFWSPSRKPFLETCIKYITLYSHFYTLLAQLCHQGRAKAATLYCPGRWPTVFRNATIGHFYKATLALKWLDLWSEHSLGTYLRPWIFRWMYHVLSLKLAKIATQECSFIAARKIHVHSWTVLKKEVVQYYIKINY